jgi:hypothetical protein
MLTLLLSSLALAGDLVVLLEAPGSVEIDGRTIASVAGERAVGATGLAGGVHRLVARDAMGRPLASANVDVGVGEELRLELRRGQLVELGRGPLAAPPPASSAPVPTGRLQITGLRPDGVAVWLDGAPVGLGAAGFVAEGVLAGTHDVRVVRGTATLFAGPMRVYPELVRRCVPTAQSLECVHVELLAPVAPPTEAAPARSAVPAERLTRLVAAIDAASFSADKLAVAGMRGADDYYTVAQLGRVMDAFSHGSDKVAVARMLAPYVLDPENAFALDAHLTFSSDRATVRALFR